MLLSHCIMPDGRSARGNGKIHREFPVNPETRREGKTAGAYFFSLVTDILNNQSSMIPIERSTAS